MPPVTGSSARSREACGPSSPGLVVDPDRMGELSVNTSIFRQQLLAAVIGTCTVGVVGLAGRRIAGDRVGSISAAIAAVYAGLWLYERALLSETFYFLVIATDAHPRVFIS